MNLEFNEKELSKQLVNLIDWKQLVFGLSCAERMFPNYILFFEKTGWGDPKIIRKSLDVTWEYIELGKSSEDLRNLAELCSEFAPNTEEFNTFFVSLALNAAGAACLLMEAAFEFNKNKIIEIATLVRDSVDLYVQEVEGMDANDPDLEKTIIEHPLMQSELKRQRNDLAALNGVSDIALNEIMKLREVWRNQLSCLNVVN